MDAEADPVAAILDEAAQKGEDWLLLALEMLSGKSLGALPPADIMEAAAPHDDAARVHGAEGRRDGPPASPAARQRHDPP